MATPNYTNDADFFRSIFEGVNTPSGSNWMDWFNTAESTDGGGIVTPAGGPDLFAPGGPLGQQGYQGFNPLQYYNLPQGYGTDQSGMGTDMYGNPLATIDPTGTMAPQGNTMFTNQLSGGYGPGLSTGTNPTGMLGDQYMQDLFLTPEAWGSGDVTTTTTTPQIGGGDGMEQQNTPDGSGNFWTSNTDTNQSTGYLGPEGTSPFTGNIRSDAPSASQTDLTNLGLASGNAFSTYQYGSPDSNNMYHVNAPGAAPSGGYNPLNSDPTQRTTLGNQGMNPINTGQYTSNQLNKLYGRTGMDPSQGDTYTPNIAGMTPGAGWLAPNAHQGDPYNRPGTSLWSGQDYDPTLGKILGQGGPAVGLGGTQQYNMDIFNKDPFLESYKNFKGAGCVLPGTKIETKRGEINIEDTKQDDLIRIYDFKTKKFGWSPIDVIFNDTVEEGWSELETASGKKLNCSNSHLMYHPEYKFNAVATDHLGIGGELYVINDDGEIEADTIVSIKVHNEPVEVWNYELELTHNYISNGILSHNKVAKSATPAPRSPSLLPLEAYYNNNLRGGDLPESYRQDYLSQQDPGDLGEIIGGDLAGVYNPAAERAWGENIQNISKTQGINPTLNLGDNEGQAGAYLSMPAVDPFTAQVETDWVKPGGVGTVDDAFTRNWPDDMDPVSGGTQGSEVGQLWRDYVGTKKSEVPTYAGGGAGDSYIEGSIGEKGKVGRAIEDIVEGDAGPWEEKDRLNQYQESMASDMTGAWGTGIGDELSARNTMGKGERDTLLDYWKDVKAESGTNVGGGLRGAVANSSGVQQRFKDEALAGLEGFGVPGTTGGDRSDDIDQYMAEITDRLGHTPGGAATGGQYFDERETAISNYMDDYGMGRTTGAVPEFQGNLQELQEDYYSGAGSEIQGFGDKVKDQYIRDYEQDLGRSQIDYEADVRSEERMRDKALGGARLEFKEAERDLTSDLAALEVDQASDRRAIRGFGGEGGLGSGRRGRQGSEAYQSMILQKEELTEQLEQAKQTRKRAQKGARKEFDVELGELGIAVGADVTDKETQVKADIMEAAEDTQKEIYGENVGMQDQYLSSAGQLLTDPDTGLAAKKAELEADAEEEIIQTGVTLGGEIKNELGDPGSGIIKSIMDEKSKVSENLFDTEGELATRLKEKADLETGFEEEVFDLTSDTADTMLSDRSEYETEQSKAIKDVGKGMSETGKTLKDYYNRYKPNTGSFYKGLKDELRGPTLLQSFANPMKRYAENTQDKWASRLDKGWQPDFLGGKSSIGNLPMDYTSQNFFGKTYNPAQAMGSDWQESIGNPRYYAVQHGEGGLGWGREGAGYGTRDSYNPFDFWTSNTKFHKYPSYTSPFATTKGWGQQQSTGKETELYTGNKRSSQY